MVIDSSAPIALLLGEPETTSFVAAIATASSRVVRAPTYLETAIVILARLGPIAREKRGGDFSHFQAQGSRLAHR